VGKLKTRVGKRKKFLALRAEFYQISVCPPWPETMPAPLHHIENTRCKVLPMPFILLYFWTEEFLGA